MVILLDFWLQVCFAPFSEIQSSLVNRCRWKVDIWNHIEFSLLAVALPLTSLTTALIANDLHFARSKFTASCLILTCRMDKLWVWFWGKKCTEKQPPLFCLLRFSAWYVFGYVWCVFWCEYFIKLNHRCKWCPENNPISGGTSRHANCTQRRILHGVDRVSQFFGG